MSQGHETKDVNARGVVGTAAGLVVVLLLVHVAGVATFDSLRAPGQVEEEDRLPPAPRLEELDRLEAKRADSREQPAVPRPPETYGWVDKKGGIVRIPIEHAMKIVVAQKRAP